MLHRRIGTNHVRLVWIAARRAPPGGSNGIFLRALRHRALHLFQKLGIARGPIQQDLRKLRRAKPDQGILGDHRRIGPGSVQCEPRRGVTHAMPSLLRKDNVARIIRAARAPERIRFTVRPVLSNHL